MVRLLAPPCEFQIIPEYIHLQFVTGEDTRRPYLMNKKWAVNRRHLAIKCWRSGELS